MSTHSRRKVLVLGGAAAGLSLLPGSGLMGTAIAQDGLEKLTFAGPPAPPTIYLAHLAKQQPIKAFARETGFLQWRTPEMLISQVLNGQVQVSATPSNTAATLYNKGAKIKLLDITTWGVLHLVTRRDDIKTFADLKGKDLQQFFRGGMPDITTRYLARKLGINPDEDMNITYATDPMQSMNMFMAGKSETAILPEPAATAVALKSKMIGKPLHRIDLQAVWTEVTGRTRVPQAGTLIQADVAERHPGFLVALKTGIDASVRWMNEQPEEAAELGSKEFGLNAPIILKAMKNVHMERVSAVDAREDLEFFYSALMELSPDLVGGRLPDDGFYLD